MDRTNLASCIGSPTKSVAMFNAHALSAALEMEPESFDYDLAIKNIQKWAVSSDLWHTAVWHSADVSDEAILDFLSTRVVEADPSSISSVLEFDLVKILRSHPLVSREGSRGMGRDALLPVLAK